MFNTSNRLCCSLGLVPPLMSKIAPMPTEPTLADVANHLVALHACVHEGHTAAAQHAQLLADELRDYRAERRDHDVAIQIQIGKVDSRLANTEGQLAIISRTIGAPAHAATAGAAALKFMDLKWWQAVLAIGGALAGATGGYQILRSAFLAFDAAMSGS